MSRYKEKEKKKVSVLGVILIIIFLPILIVNATLIIKSYIHPDEIASFMGYKPFIVLSGSMEPTIMTGDMAIVKEVDTNTLQKGDVIAFRSGNSVVTHRIIEVAVENNQKVLVTKGDNNNAEDRDKVTLDKVEGVCIKRIAKLGNFAMFLQTTWGSIIFISIPFALLIINGAIQRRKDNKEQAKKQEELERQLRELKQDKEKELSNK